MGYEKSKNLEDGILVSLRGNKFIRASSRSRVKGCYTTSKYSRVLKFDGDYAEILIPEGIIKYGYAEVKAHESVWG